MRTTHSIARVARSTCTNSGMSPLILSSENGYFEDAIASLEAGADTNDERTGYTPLHAVTWLCKPMNSDCGSDLASEGSGNQSSSPNPARPSCPRS